MAPSGAATSWASLTRGFVPLVCLLSRGTHAVGAVVVGIAGVVVCRRCVRLRLRFLTTKVHVRTDGKIIGYETDYTPHDDVPRAN